VKATAAVEATITASEAAAVEALALASAKAASPIIETTPPVESAAVITAAIVTATVETRTPIKAVEPRAGADKEAVCKVVWAVVAVRRAIIWVIPVVAVGANRSRPVVARTNSDADNHSLRVRRSCRRQCENRQ
jgi:hypothetical protein